MKTRIVFLLGIGLVSSALLVFGNNSKTFETKRKPNGIEVNSGDKYRVTAQTRNAYGQNYWIDLVDEGSTLYGSNSIYGVYYNDGYGLKQISYYVDYEYENSYWVSIDSRTYYFTF